MPDPLQPSADPAAVPGNPDPATPAQAPVPSGPPDSDKRPEDWVDPVADPNVLPHR
ncbi:hypothetical protein [Pseudomonas sp. Marseille-Q5115]|uniref:hypothetical protein n=1 Tax=Pseudomonas sp. Marseille-Q5115 TaxID=2866593 RepID=UPI001CE42F34|nr:hypothetical protein [Pseudomonas sp. Marseille-Q5115]